MLSIDSLQDRVRKDERRLRLRVVDIQLNKPAKRPISIELLVDKQSFYKFSSIDKDKKLHWESEVLYMHPESLMIFILREKHSLSYKTEICRFSVQGGAALKVASEGNGQPEVLIVEAAKARLSLAFSVDGIYEEAVKGSTTRAMEMLQKKKEVMDKLSVVREFVENILTFVGPLSEVSRIRPSTSIYNFDLACIPELFYCKSRPLHGRNGVSENSRSERM
ncbi:hypothetical protein DFH11DRAFT_929124 [Phellopilus nigrolimitatus]|nr:hypothetical protein DFH11DRAFT_929124 [Phellopilus nigrolimitatus]